MSEPKETLPTASDVEGLKETITKLLYEKRVRRCEDGYFIEQDEFPYVAEEIAQLIANRESPLTSPTEGEVEWKLRKAVARIPTNNEGQVIGYERLEDLQNLVDAAMTGARLIKQLRFNNTTGSKDDE